jgi:GT2 family glycosyltransferase
VANIGIFSLSPLDRNCLLEQSIKNTDGVDLFVKYNNKTVGMPEYYNSIIDSDDHKKYEYVVFCHDDVSLEYCNFNTVARALNQYDIAGVAGGLNPVIGEKNLWHWMMPREEQRGFAGHAYANDALLVTTFGPSPARVAVLDGVFLAINIRRLRPTKARFDTNFMWHHYDIDFSLTCNRNKLKLGVWPFLINHKSPGLLDINNKEWNRSNEYFKRKWQPT